MRHLRDSYLDDSRVQSLYDAFISNSGATCGACQDSFATVLIAALCEKCIRNNHTPPALIICTQADALLDDLEELGIRAALLYDIGDWESDSAGDRDRFAYSQRVSALKEHLSGAILLATPRSAEQLVPDLKQLSAASITLHIGDCHDMHELAESLIENTYNLCTVVEKRGDIAVRGGLIDIYPWIGEHAIRIEFFGDEIDTMRSFDCFTQESIAQITEIQLLTTIDSIPNQRLWQQLPPQPIISLGDFPINDRLKTPMPFQEIRFARQLEHDSIDGASTSINRLQGDALHDFTQLQALCAAQETTQEVMQVLVFARNEEAELDLQHCMKALSCSAEIRRGRIGGGFCDQEKAICVVHDYELNHRKPVRKRKTQKLVNAAPLSSLSDLRQGNYIVHLRHGIGRFRGMATLEKNGYLEDHLLLEFADNAKIYTPISAIDVVQKYIGGGGRHPELSRIGSKAWANKRAKAEKSIEDLTGELLTVHAARVAVGGIAFSAENTDSRRFDARFPFEETADQLSAIRDIKTDMEKSQYMDRLLCGDVGFGKTEVAMRAAFKAVHDGYQVAVLAPTTLLTEQHALSFTQRFKDVAITIACINRFRNTSDRRDILEKTADGSIDILIGTHALLSKKLSFKNLGLLIVDEEQRFGVKQKEIISSLRVGVDVLTMTATPIPRTLHFSMLGLRDISVIAEAPAQRVAVETKVAIWDKRLIRQAMEYEIERKGQIFFVHNRVKDIDSIAFKLSRLVPEMRIEVIHGQMHEQRISEVMSAYKRGDIDCLVATSIIESGIDIPNANTLFVNNAHCFGLSELHQIRGRIGRWTRQAHAFFLIPNRSTLSKDAQERLDAIQEYSELGAGFKLAMRDLELRGAGNLLGSEQSGHIDAIGYELYCKLLAEAVARQGGPLAAEVQAGLKRSDSYVKLQFSSNAYIPDEYLETPSLKFEVHKAIDDCQRVSEVEHLCASLRDRFGNPVLEVQRLLRLKCLRIRCHQRGITRIDLNDRHIRLHLSAQIPDLDADSVPELLHIEASEGMLCLFMREEYEHDPLIDLLSRLLGINLQLKLHPPKPQLLT